MVRACLVYIFFKLFFRTFFKNTKNNKKVLSENSYLFFKFIIFFYVFQEKENWKPNKFHIFKNKIETEVKIKGLKLISRLFSETQFGL